MLLQKKNKHKGFIDSVCSMETCSKTDTIEVQEPEPVLQLISKMLPSLFPVTWGINFDGSWPLIYYKTAQ